MTIKHDCEQYSDAWYELRKGMPTASQFHNIVTPTGAPTRGDRRRKYMHRLIAERLLGQSMDDRFQNYWTKRGRELQDDAVKAFLAEHKEYTADAVGFMTSDDKRIGASPDRLLLTGEGVAREAMEIKCPAPWVQIDYLLEGPDENFKPQVQGQMLVGEFEAMHLWCWHPQMPPVHVLTLRDEDFIEKLAKELWYFCNELDAETDRARGLGSYRLAETLRLSLEMTSEELPGVFPWLQ